MLALLALLALQAIGDQEIRRELSAEAAALERSFLPDVKTAGDFEGARARLRKEYFFMLGLDPRPEATPLKPVVTGRLEFDDYTVEKLHFQSRPGLYVTANLYLPKPLKGPYPAILYQCGHAGRGRNGNKSAYQDHGIWFARHGYVALVTDTLQLGEIAAIHHGTYREQRWWWHSRGYTSAGVECWNAIRGLDYLETRPEVDAARIGATGISGGGAATFWISAADDRVRVSVPVSGMADLGFYVGKDGVNGHCDCMFLYNNYRWNWTTIAALICPRPLLFTNSDADRIFPMSANERVINRLERLYSKFGESDRVDAMVSVGRHAYRTDLRRAIFEFMNRHLKGDASRVEDPDSGRGEGGKPRIPLEDLRVFPTDGDIPKDQVNTRIDETFVPVAEVALPGADGFETWRDGMVARLREVCFPTLPDGPARKGEATLTILNQDEDAGPDRFKPRGGWTRKNPPNTIERSYVLLGRTVDSERVCDIVREIRRIGAVHLAGRGEAGVLAAYAALFEPTVKSVTLIDPPASHAEGPHFLSVLRILDIPEALGLLAPRRLVLVDAKDKAFDRTEALFKLAGAADKILH